MSRPWVRPAVIVSVLLALLLLNAREFRSKRLALQERFNASDDAGTAPRFALQQALQALTIEQLLHMIHTMLAAILAALLWT